ncbi:insulin-like 3 (Leydig cell) [Neosynchiropus ocellatus]
MSPAKCLPSVLVLLVVAACAAQTEVRFKMCGRELIRMTVSTCGNSRLKRSVLNGEEGRPTHTSDGDPIDAIEKQGNLFMPSQSPGDERIMSPAPQWVALSSRLGRAAGKMSDICCERGCSLKDLIQFC